MMVTIDFSRLLHCVFSLVTMRIVGYNTLLKPLQSVCLAGLPDGHPDRLAIAQSAEIHNLDQRPPAFTGTGRGRHSDAEGERGQATGVGGESQAPRRDGRPARGWRYQLSLAAQSRGGVVAQLHDD